MLRSRSFGRSQGGEEGEAGEPGAGGGWGWQGNGWDGMGWDGRGVVRCERKKKGGLDDLSMNKIDRVVMGRWGQMLANVGG